MTVEPSKPTETVPGEGEPNGAGAQATTEAAETPEQKRIRELEEETTRLKNANEAQAGQIRAWQPKVEAFNVLQKATGQPGSDATASPTGAAGGGTLEDQLNALRAEYQQFGLVTTANQIIQLEAEIQRRQRVEEWNRFREAAKLVFDALPDRDVAARALSIFDTGNVGDPQVAIHAARAQLADEKSNRPTPTKTTPTPEQAARPATVVASDSGGGGTKTMPASEYDRIIASGSPQATKLMRQKDRGDLLLDYSR